MNANQSPLTFREETPRGAEPRPAKAREETEEVPDIFCGAASRPKTVYVVDGFPVLECQRCGLAWVSPRLTTRARFQEVYHAGYMNTPPPSTNSLKALRKRISRSLKGLFRPTDGIARRLAEVEKFGPANGRLQLLEVGCWTGDVLALAAARHPVWQIAGVEPTAWAVEKARSRGLPVTQGFLEDAPLADACSDVVLAWNTLEHVPDPHRFLRRARRLLVPGGRLILHLPNWNALLRRLLRNRWSELKPRQHLFHFNRRTLRRLLEECGFDVLFMHSGTPMDCSNQLFAVGNARAG